MTKIELQIVASCDQLLFVFHLATTGLEDWKDGKFLEIATAFLRNLHHSILYSSLVHRCP